MANRFETTHAVVPNRLEPIGFSERTPEPGPPSVTRREPKVPTIAVLTFLWGMLPAVAPFAKGCGVYFGLYAQPVVISMLLIAALANRKLVAGQILAAAALAFVVGGSLLWATNQAVLSHMPPGLDDPRQAFTRQIEQATKGAVPRDGDGHYLYPVPLRHAPALAPTEVRYRITADRDVARRRWATDGPAICRQLGDPTYYLPAGFAPIRRPHSMWWFWLEVVLVPIGLNIASVLWPRGRRAEKRAGGCA